MNEAIQGNARSGKGVLSERARILEACKELENLRERLDRVARELRQVGVGLQFACDRGHQAAEVDRREELRHERDMSVTQPGVSRLLWTPYSEGV